jgi:dienelactone hydrolase
MEEASRIIPAGEKHLAGDLELPGDTSAVVLFAHGTGSSRHSPRNRFVAEALNEAGLATLLMDLLTASEEEEEAATGHLRFDIGLLAQRLSAAVTWLQQEPDTKDMSIGLFGASTGASAALVTAARRPQETGAIVSRGGRPDLAGAALADVQAPTLLIVGGADHVVLDLNRAALDALAVEKRLDVVPGASHLFGEEGALERVAELAREWFLTHLGGS